MRVLKAAAISCTVFCSMFGASASNATTVESFDNGWYQTNGTTFGLSNIYVGANNNTGSIYNNWLAFDLSAFAAQNITSATLTFYGGNGNNTSSSATETLGLFDYTGSISALVGNQSSSSIANDLGSGVSYGTATLSAGPIPQFSVTLNSAAIANLNAAANNALDHRLIIGGAVLGVDSPFSNRALFVINGPQPALEHAAFLDLQVAAVPEPSTWAMMLLGFAGIGFVTYRRARKDRGLALAA